MWSHSNVDWAYNFQYGKSVQVAADDESYRPQDLRLYRFITFFHGRYLHCSIVWWVYLPPQTELYDTPGLPELFGDGTFYLQYTIFSYTTRIPLQVFVSAVLVVCCLTLRKARRRFRGAGSQATCIPLLGKRIRIS